MILLFVITIIQFSSWGYDSVIWILSTMFDVNTNATPLHLVTGILAMVSSAFVFVGAALWWNKKISARRYFSLGASGFIVKNGFDIINTVWVFSLTHTVVSAGDIRSLATDVGTQLFQFAFWIFILMYFRSKISSSQM